MLKKIVLFVLVLTVSVGVFGCEAEYISEEINSLPNIKYMKDSKGLCYAYSNSRTYYGYVTFSISNVPCEKVGL